MNSEELKKYVKAEGIDKKPKEKHVTNLYLPAAQKGTMIEGGKKVPIHHLHTMTRSEAMSNLILDSEYRYGALGTAYKSYFYAIVCFALTVLTYNFNLYVAAAFAYLAGTYWSQRLCAPPWNLTWYKGKALYHTV